MARIKYLIFCRIMALFMALIILCEGLLMYPQILIVNAAGFSTSNSGIELIKSFEGCKLYAYKAVQSETYYTIGYGHYGSDVYEGMTITQAQAEEMLKNDLKKYEGYVNTFLNNNGIVISQNQFDALVSFTYNLGNVWVSTPTFQLKTILCNGCENYSPTEITTAFTNWNKSGGKVLEGLTRRRRAEAEMFINGMTNNDPDPVWTKDNSYPVPFKAYPNNGSSKTTVYNNKLTAYNQNTRNIAPDDLCTISAVYTNGYCEVTYPTGSGTHTEYAKTSDFIPNSVERYNYKPSQELITYIRSDLLTTFGKVYITDNCTVVGKSGNLLHIIYPITNGYKLGWINPPETIPPSEFPTPLYSYNASPSERTTVYESLSTMGIYYGQIFVDDKCTLNSVSISGGWINVTYPTGNTTKTGYVYLDQFIPSESRLTNFYTASVSQQTTTYRKNDMSVSYGYVSVGDTITVVGKSGSKLQVLYPLDTGGYKLAWIYDTYIVKEIKEIRISSEPAKTTYLEGENFNSAGLAVYGIYKDGTTENITEKCTISGYSNTPGIKTITVTYSNQKAIFNVVVNKKSLTKIQITSLPTKTTYDVGEDINLTGIKVMAYFDNCTSEEAYDYSVDGSNLTSTVGSKTVNVKYVYEKVSKTASFNIVIAHNFGEWTTTQNAYCGVGGIQTRKCKGCGYEETREITAKEHEYTIQVISPTCTEQGYTLHTCKNCSYSYKDTYTNALGHQYNIQTINPTCTEQGYTLHTCKNCSYSYKDNYTNALGHQYNNQITEPTCTNKGYTVHTCINCGENYKDTYTEALGHNYNEQIISPTIDSQGYTLHSCTRCGDSYKDNYTDPVSPIPSVLAGDINGDGKVNMKDLTRLHQYVNNWDVEVVEAVIDVNGDGKVNMKDVTRLHQYINEWDVDIYVNGVLATTKLTAQEVVYGKSELGKDLKYYDFKPANYNSTVLLNFAIHGYEDEYAADAQILVDTAEALIDHYNTSYPNGCKTRLIIIPCANPDGLYDGNTNNGFGRCNANGVDLNRDFDANYTSYSSARNYTQYAFSASESRALRDLYLSVSPKVVVDFHGWENCTIGNYEIAQIFEEEMGLSHNVNFMTNNASGYFSNWAYQQGSYSLLVEFTNSYSIDFDELVKSVDRMINEDYFVSEKDSNYQKFDTITCYALSTDQETTYKYFDKPFSSSSYIDGKTDQCILLGIYENGWVKVQYPITNGYKAAYCTLDTFISPSEQVQIYQYSVQNNTSVYKRKDLAEKFGTVYSSDIIYVVAETDNALQIIYTLDAGGWKMGWILK